MAFKRFQNVVAESRFTFPFFALLTIAVCVKSGMVEQRLWVQTACLALSTYLMIELNNVNQLLRIYSRMVSASFLLLTSVSCFLYPDLLVSIITLCTAALYVSLFHCYQLRMSAGWVYYGFLCVGLASLVFVQYLYFVPFIWAVMIFNLRTMRARSFSASLLGILTPYWFASIYLLYMGQYEWIPQHFMELAVYGPICDYTILNEHQLVTFAFIGLLALTGIIHYLRNGYADKIRTRMYFQIFVVMDIAALVFIVLQPQHYNLLLAFIIVNTSPLIAHFITLTHTWITNIVFYLILLLAFAIIAYHLWMPSSIFL